MKKYIKYSLLAGIIAISLFPADCFSFENLSSSKQPDGFRGVFWGASKLDHPYLFYVYDTVNGVETMHRELESLSLGKAKLREITYHFYNDKFFQVLISLRSNKDHQPLLDALTEAHGTPELESGIYIWENNTVSIRLFPEGASISYLPILNSIYRKNSNG